jgi:hypothetical protein
LAQIVHLSYTDINIISKRTETSFHMSHVTKEFRWMCRKQFLSLWYIWLKPCTYLASRLAVSRNRMKQASTCALSARCTIGCIQNDFRAYGTFGTNQSCTDPNTVSKWTETRFQMTHVTKEFHRVCPKSFVSLWYVQRKPCTYLASSLPLSPNGLNRAST